MNDLIYKLFYGQPLSKIIFIMILLVFVWAGLNSSFVSKHRKKRQWRISNGICWLCMAFLILSG